MEFKEVITWMDWITIVFSFFAMLAAGLNWWNDRKQKKLSLTKIKIFFKVEGIEEDKPRFEIIRKDLTRAEIAGYLSVFQKNSKDRYNIPYLLEETYFQDIFNIQNGQVDDNKLVIEMSKEEQDKFIDIHKTNI
jgi:hypothetical protein